VVLVVVVDFRELLVPAQPTKDLLVVLVTAQQ
jgi:hypothetical protein